MNNKPHHGIFEFLSVIFRKLFDQFSFAIEKILFNDRGLVLISLIISIFICVAIDYDTIRIRLLNDKTTTVTISDVKVDVLYDEKLYKVKDIPSSVEISLTGESKDIQVFRQQQQIKVIADLRKCESGSNIIDLTVDSLPASISAKVSPSTVTAKLSQLVARNFTVSAELLVGSNQKVTDFSSPKLSTYSVSIVGTKEELDSIRIVKALVDVTGQYSDFETSAKLVAYDANGNALDVKIDPTSINASVSLKTESNKE